MYTDYGYYDATSSAVSSLVGGILIFIAIFWLIGIATTILVLVANYKIYKKAGKKGWESLIPIYNIIVLLEIVELPTWYIALFVVPLANIYAMFKINIELAHKFGKDTLFGILTVFFNFVFLPILAFGKSEFKGNSNKQENINQTVQPQPEVRPVVNPVQAPVQPQPEVKPVVNPAQTPVQPQPEVKPVVNPAQAPVQPQPEVRPVVNPVQTPVQPQPEVKPVVNPAQTPVQPQPEVKPVVNPAQAPQQLQNPEQTNN